MADALLDRALRMWPSRPGKAVYRTLDAVMLRRVPLSPPVLDLGCGNGEFATLTGLAPALGVDRSIPDCRSAASSGRYTHVLAADLHALPVGGERFASAYCNSTLEHVERPEVVLQEAARVIRPGGTIALTVPTPRKREWLYYAECADAIAGDHNLAERYRAAFDEYWAHRHYFESADLAGLLGSAGFTVTQLAPYESRSVSQAIDVLNQLRLDWPAEAAGSTADLVRAGTRAAIHRHLRPLVADPGVGSGASLLCVAVRGG